MKTKLFKSDKTKKVNETDLFKQATDIVMKHVLETNGKSYNEEEVQGKIKRVYETLKTGTDNL